MIRSIIHSQSAWKHDFSAAIKKCYCGCDKYNARPHCMYLYTVQIKVPNRDIKLYYAIMLRAFLEQKNHWYDVTAFRGDPHVDSFNIHVLPAAGEIGKVTIKPIIELLKMSPNFNEKTLAQAYNHVCGYLDLTCAAMCE